MSCFIPYLNKSTIFAALFNAKDWVSMSKRKVFQSQVIDGRTGEVLEDRAVFVSNSASEIFGMYRRTVGLDWFFSLTGNEIKVLVYLSSISDADGFVALTKKTRVAINHILGFKQDRSLSNILVELDRKDAIFRGGIHEVNVNPATFFRCKSSELPLRIAAYNVMKFGREKGGMK